MGMPGSPAHTSSQKGSDDAGTCPRAPIIAGLLVLTIRRRHAELGVPAVLDGEDCVATHREKSRLAQKRFRQRQKVGPQQVESRVPPLSPWADLADDHSVQTSGTAAVDGAVDMQTAL